MRRIFIPNKNAIALILLSMGLGMLLIILIPTWGFVLAVGMIALGLWLLFMC